jgi:hypothetical protein
LWADAEDCFARYCRTLAAAGVVVKARLVRWEGLLSAYTDGEVRLSLPDPGTAGGRLQGLMLSTMMGLTPRDLEWLFRALLPRLVAHEIGHALRAGAGLLGSDVREEEQIADRLGELLSRPDLSSGDRARARTMLGEVVGRLGQLEAAAGLHRHAAQAAARLGLAIAPDEVQRLGAHLQAHYYRDIDAYLRVTVAWALIDLTLCEEDSLERFCIDHLSLAP